MKIKKTKRKTMSKYKILSEKACQMRRETGTRAAKCRKEIHRSII